MNSTIRAVIFDMDGVLVDSEPLINAAAIAMFKEKGLIVQPDDFLPFVGAGEARYIGGVAEKYQFALDIEEAKQRTYEIYLDLIPSRLKAFPGVYDFVLAAAKPACVWRLPRAPIRSKSLPTCERSICRRTLGMR